MLRVFAFISLLTGNWSKKANPNCVSTLAQIIASVRRLVFKKVDTIVSTLAHRIASLYKRTGSTGRWQTCVHNKGIGHLLFKLLLLTISSIVALGPLQAKEKPASLIVDSPSFLKKVFIDLETKIRYLEFANGLKLILLKQGFAPVVSCYMKFRAGSYDEPPTSFGIAHMLEHMLFKGTRKVGTRDFSREEKYLQLSVRFAEKLDHWRRIYKQILEQSGNYDDKESEQIYLELENAAKPQSENGENTKDSSEIANIKEKIRKWQRRLDILNRQKRAYVIQEQDAYIYALHGARGYNAYTSSDLTNYQVNIPVNRLEVWARLESDRMQNAVLRDFYTEREVVREERRMRVENTSRSQLWEKFRLAIYKGHPYGHPVIGTRESIAFLNYHQAMEFYNTYYAPNNTVIALVGNINIDATEKLVRQYFGKLQSRKVPVEKKAKPLRLRPVHVQQQAKKGDNPLLYMAWLKPPIPDPNDLYLDILSGILTGSPETRLYQRLIVKEKLAVSVFSRHDVIGDRSTNLFLLGVRPAPGVSLDRIQTVILEEIDRLRLEDVTQEELLLVCKRKRFSIANLLENNASLANLLSYFEMITGDYRSLFRYNELLDTVQPKHIRAAVNTYLQPKLVMTARLVPTH